jgi:putative MATE family efflux protein
VSAAAVGDASGRRIIGLAVPALGVLAAEPLYILVDTAVLGHLGAVALGALGVGGVLLSQVAMQGNFLAYGTTARAARWYGAGNRAAAVGEGVQASYLALALGLLVVAVGQALAGPATRLIAGGPGEVQAGAEQWLRIAVCGAPFILMTIAGNGWMRGVQETRRPLRYVLTANALSAILNPLLVYPAGLGLAGSAIANVAAQAFGAALFALALRRELAGGGVHTTPRWEVLRAQLVLARDLVARTLGMQVCFLAAAGVAARIGTAQIGAHQIALQLWMFLALVLDAYAIAAQALVGGALGAGEPGVARRVAWKVTRYGGVTGVLFALGLLAGWYAVPALFTTDQAVLAQAHLAWPWFAAMQPAAGVVFALDGVLIGAGDVRFLRTTTVAAALLGFLPVTLIAAAADLGLGGIWAGLTLFIAIRLVAVTLRTRNGGWAVTGTELAGRRARRAAKPGAPPARSGEESAGVEPLEGTAP